MRRIFSILICFIFSISILSFSVSATSDQLYIDLVEFNSHSNSTSFNGTNVFLSYELPDRLAITYVDIIFSYSTGADISVDVYDQNDYLRGYLQVKPIGGSFFRAFGSIDNRYYSELKLQFRAPSSVSGRRITVDSFKVTSVAVTRQAIPGTLSGFAMGQEVSSKWATESQACNISFPVSNIDGAIFNATYWVDKNWMRHDFLDFSIAFDCLSIDSIVCETANGSIIPFTMSYLSSSDNYNLKIIDLSLDLRNLQRDDGLFPYVKVYVTGTLKRDTVQHAYLYHAYGLTGFSNPDAEIFWYQRLFNAITDGFDALLSALGFNSSDPEFNEDAQEKVDDLDDLSSQLDSVSPPDISDVNFNVSGLVNPNVVTLTTSGISNILSNEIILRVLIISATFAVAGFILYGKK